MRKQSRTREIIARKLGIVKRLLLMLRTMVEAQHRLWELRGVRHKAEPR